MFFETLQINMLGEWLGVLLPDSRIYFLYILSAIIIAFIAYWRIEKAHDDHEHDSGAPAPEQERPASFIQYILDPKIIFHNSTKQDLKFFLVNAFIYAGIASQFMLTTQGVAWFAHGTLEAGFGVLEAPIMTTAMGLIVYTILSVLVIDFIAYGTHALQHRWPLLWHFHAVHHSAEVMTPLTLYRMHPVDIAFTAVAAAIGTGISYAGLFYMTGEEPQQMTVLGLNIIVMLFYVFGYNLRHSHIWVAYPVWLSRIFISPAQHQIHHSSDPKHFDKNMGLIFSFWDGMFGSLYIPRRFEKLTFGLSRDNPNPFKSIADIYIMPFGWARETISNWSQGRSIRKVEAYGAIALLVVAIVGTDAYLDGKRPGWHLQSLMLADLTWTEAHEALERGYDTVIVPTGGVEQNGPFVALGKHNFIVEKTATEMATALGNTLVAPVMAYVPEGDIESREGHMAFTGTLSLPEPVFEDVLEATVASLRAHGFKNVFIVGDSGSSQDAQQRVAQRLAARWGGEGMRIANIGDYYFGNGQTDHLKLAGYDPLDIGTHAGIRDTSEVLYVSREHVRFDNRDIPDGFIAGINGTPGMASKAIGKDMVALKVEAGLAQMRALLAAAPGAAVPAGQMVMDDGTVVDTAKTAGIE
ncbi:MAG: creatininase family protein [Ahrensia sp.]